LEVLLVDIMVEALDLEELMVEEHLTLELMEVHYKIELLLLEEVEELEVITGNVTHLLMEMAVEV